MIGLHPFKIYTYSSFYVFKLNMHVCIFRTHNGDLMLFVFFVVTGTYEQLVNIVNIEICQSKFCHFAKG